jgi:steroid delta-isomerase-like uncharacterized protein
MTEESQLNFGRRKEDSLRERREKIVNQHIDAENNADLDGLIASFFKPHYEVIPMSAVVDGEKEVRELFGGIINSFPDFHFDLMTLYHADNAVIVEGTMTGTHEREFAGMPPKGKKMAVRVAAIFDFDDDKLVNETVYFDFATLQQQIS